MTLQAARGAAVVASGALLLSVAACDASSTAGDRQSAPAARATSVPARLGRVPIPSAPAEQPTASAARGRVAVLAMGAPVAARLGGGTRALLTVLGPVQGTTRPGAPSTRGTFTVRVRPTAGTLRIAATDLSSRDETGGRVALRPVGPSAVTATGAHPGSLRVSGRYGSGAAQVTYRHAGRVVAVWDFNIELD